MSRSKWMPVLLAGGLVCAVAKTGGGAAPGPTAVTYDSSKPDSPFVGAWDGDQPDCSDPHAETECWKCEQSASGGSAFPVPKFWYETEVTCPQLEIKEKTHDECVCELEGTKKTVKVQATADTTDGMWRYVPKGEPGCGTDGPENPIKFKEIKWAWKTVGRPGGDLMKIGDLARFDYVVPNGDVNISVVFKARGIPDDSRCSDVMDGPEAVGVIIGKGIPKLHIEPVPPPLEDYASVRGLIDGKGGGKHDPNDEDETIIIPVGVAPCYKFQIAGQFSFIGTISICDCIIVTGTTDENGDPCALNVGECNPVTDEMKKAIKAHEDKHYNAWKVLVDSYNYELVRAPLFSSPDEAGDYLAEICSRYNQDKADLRIRQRRHTDFAGEIRHTVNDCGEIIDANKTYPIIEGEEGFE